MGQNIFHGLLSVFIIILFSQLQTFAGVSFLSVILKKEKDWPASFKVASGYFLGVVLFLFLFRASAQFFSAQFSFYISTVVLFLVALYGFLKKSFRDFYQSKNLKLFFIFFFSFLPVAVILLFYWLNIPSVPLSPFDTIGSLHSGRYAGISHYIFANNLVPILPQNYGQSLLAVIPYFFGVKTPSLNLYVWLMVSQFYLILFTWGLLGIFNLSKRKMIFGTAFIMAANSALSLTHVLVIDSGSPFILNGYTDSLVGLVTFIFLLYWLYLSWARDDKKYRVIDSLLVIVTSVVWCMIAPQNNILFAGFSFCALLYNIFKNRKLVGRSILVCIFVILFTLIGRFQGGMLAPAGLISKTDIPGMMSLSEESKNDPVDSKKISLLPYLQQNVGYAGHWVLWPQNSSVESVAIPFVLEEWVWSAVRTLFFPLIGIGGLLIGLIRKRINFGNDGLIYYSTLTTLVIFGGGLFVTYLFKLNGYKWELTRFLIPGLYLSMVSFVIYINKLVQKGSRFKNVVIAVILVLPLAGPFWSCLLFIMRKLYLHHDLYPEIFNLFLTK